MDEWRDGIATISACVAIALASGAIVGVVAGLLFGLFEPGAWLAAVFTPCLGALVVFGRKLWTKHDTGDEPPADDAPAEPPPAPVQEQPGPGDRDGDADLPPRVGDPS